MLITHMIRLNLAQKCSLIYKQSVKYCSSQSGDILQNIKDEDLPSLRDMYKENWPKLIEPYLFLDNFIQWKQKNPATKVEFLCPHGKWDDGTFVAIAKHGIHNIYFFTLDKSCDRLSKGLQETKKIDWKKGPMIYSVHEDFRNKINPILSQVNQPKRVVCDIFTWYLPKEDALKYEDRCPSDGYIDKLQPYHAEELNKTWAMKSPGTEEYLENLIRMNSGIGMYSKRNHEFMSSVVLTDMGNMGVIQTPRKYRKMGYGKIVMEHICKKRAETIDVTGYTFQENHAMNALLTSMGFKIMYQSTLWHFVSSE